jgi:hypothetical protein
MVRKKGCVVRPGRENFHSAGGARVLATFLKYLELQPVPQKRHGALSQRTPSSPCSAIAVVLAGMVMPAVAAAATAA